MQQRLMAAATAAVAFLAFTACGADTATNRAATTSQPAPAQPATSKPAAPANAAATPTGSHGTSAGAQLKNADGSTFTVADIPGKAKVINVWATWCAPCIGEMPILNEIAKKYESQGVTFVAVSVDENGPSDVDALLARGKLKIDFRKAYASFDDLAPLDVAAPIPDTLVFDGQNQLVKHFDKIIEREELEAAIKQALGTPAK
jgi:thiol-disulfide isomerase/thioredoxin